MGVGGGEYRECNCTMYINRQDFRLLLIIKKINDFPHKIVYFPQFNENRLKEITFLLY